jgi:hypothetical protein
MFQTMLFHSNNAVVRNNNPNRLVRMSFMCDPAMACAMVSGFQVASVDAVNTMSVLTVAAAATAVVWRPREVSLLQITDEIVTSMTATAMIIAFMVYMFANMH